MTMKKNAYAWLQNIHICTYTYFQISINILNSFMYFTKVLYNAINIWVLPCLLVCLERILGVYFKENIRNFKKKWNHFWTHEKVEDIYIFQSVHWDSCVFYMICLLHFSMCYCWPACIFGHHVQTSACRIRKRSSDLLDLGYRQLSCAILLLRVKPWSFEKAAIVLNYWTVSVAPPYAFQEKNKFRCL